jgi:1-deoxy-D-xylulose-5-phosphate reductoisomerase
VAVLADESLADEFSKRLSNSDCDTELLVGPSALDEIARDPAVDIVMAGIIGSAGLSSSLAAVDRKENLIGE